MTPQQYEHLTELFHEALEISKRLIPSVLSGMPWVKVDPKFDNLRADLRFVNLSQRIGFTA